MKHRSDEIVFLLAVSPLAARYADRLPDFVGTVTKEIGLGESSVRIWWKSSWINIGCTYIIQVIRIGKAIEYFKSNVYALI